MTYGEGIIYRLPEHSALHNLDNPFRKILVNGIGALLDEFSVGDSREGVYFQNAENEYLDAHGRVFNIERSFEESDEHYRNRIVYETLGFLSTNYLLNVYDLTLYVFVEDFNVHENTLTSDNPYVSHKYMCFYDGDVQPILDNKFVIYDGVWWINSNGTLDYVMKGNVNVINEYPRIYKTGLTRLFKDNTLITKVNLKLDNALKCLEMFRGCTSLISADVDMGSATDCRTMFYGCTSLKKLELNILSATNIINICRGCSSLEEVTINMPVIEEYTTMLMDCPALKYINLTVPAGSVAGIKSYISDLNLQYLETLIINGEEVTL